MILPGVQGKGKLKSANRLMLAKASAAISTVSRKGKTLAAIVTGAMISTEKGFCKPPVKNNSALNCTISKAMKPAASRSLKNRCGENLRTVNRLSQALAAIAPRHKAQRRWKAKTKMHRYIIAMV